jgi:hypothetical protein
MKMKSIVTELNWRVEQLMESLKLLTSNPSLCQGSSLGGPILSDFPVEFAIEEAVGLHFDCVNPLGHGPQEPTLATQGKPVEFLVLAAQSCFASESGQQRSYSRCSSSKGSWYDCMRPEPSQDKEKPGKMHEENATGHQILRRDCTNNDVGEVISLLIFDYLIGNTDRFRTEFSNNVFSKNKISEPLNLVYIDNTCDLTTFSAARTQTFSEFLVELFPVMSGAPSRHCIVPKKMRASLGMYGNGQVFANKLVDIISKEGMKFNVGFIERGAWERRGLH